MSKEIWCLFSIENLYDQPLNNLVAWWRTRPNLEQLFKVMNVDLNNEEGIIACVGVLKSQEEGQVRYNNADYRLVQIVEGLSLDRGDL